MCGIAGFISKNILPAKIAKQMADVIRHRGPDDEGFVLFHDIYNEPLICGGEDTPEAVFQESVPYAPTQLVDTNTTEPARIALGHRRLSIVDLSPLGHQPMCSPDGRYWIVYNGEVYNHVELRAELEQDGYHFRSHADTEVIIAAYHKWGEACLSRFNGMWGLAIYDTKAKTIFLARDRFGVKPLYYWISPEGFFAFASEIKQFTDMPGWQPQVNGQRAYDYLAFGLTDHTDETLFRDVFQLEPGHFITFKIEDCNNLKPKTRIRSKQWYRLAQSTFAGTFEDAIAEFRQRFMDSVRLRLRADVPVGSCLSGGLDSSSIVCGMNQLLEMQNTSAVQKTFSACSDEQRFDERKWIEMVVEATDVEAHYVYPSLERLFDESRTITWHQDEPYGSTSIYAQWNVFRLAKEASVKVMLDGQGADEQLAGYHGYFGARMSTLFKEIQWLELLKEIRALKRVHNYSFIRSGQYLANYLLPDSIGQSLKRITGYAHSRPDWLDWEGLGARPHDPLLDSGAREGSVEALSVSQLTASNLQMLLHWEDRNSMAHSVESRVPFLDYGLVEFVLGLPDEFKLHRGITKRVLRESMGDVLPEKIRDRTDKLGFVTPEEVWLREKAPQQFRCKLNESIEISEGIIKPGARNILEDMVTGNRRFSFQVWRIVNFGEWMETFSVSR